MKNGYRYVKFNSSHYNLSNTNIDETDYNYIFDKGTEFVPFGELDSSVSVPTFFYIDTKDHDCIFNHTYMTMMEEILVGDYFKPEVRKQIVDRLVNDKNYYLLIYNYNDSDVFIGYEPNPNILGLFNSQRNLWDTLNIPFDKIRWVGNNLVVEKVLNSDNNYVNYKYNFHPPGHAWSSLSDCDPKNNPTSWNIFFRDTNRVGSFGNHPELLFDQFLKSDKREKRFLCLNRAPRPHRVELVLFLKSLSNQSENYFSLIGDCEIFGNPTDEYDMDYIKKLRQESTWIKDEFEYGLEYIYKNSYLNLNTSVHSTNYSTYIDSKVLNPTMNYQPFLFYTSPYVLHNLKLLGFETYPELFDESYDDILITSERFRIVKENVLKYMKMPIDELHKLYWSVEEKLKHNNDRYWKLCDTHELEIQNWFTRYLGEVVDGI